MLDKRIRKQIEWAFYNYEANRKLGAEQVVEIAEEGLTAQYGVIGGRANTISNPTESKVLRLNERTKLYHWAKVVENTLSAFRFELGYDMLIEKYFHPTKLTNKKLMTKYFIPERTYFRFLDRVLERAYMWVEEYALL